MAKAIAIWFGLTLLGVLAGVLAGLAIYAVGFEVLGGAVMIIGGGFGGIIALIVYMKRKEAF